MAHRKKTLRRMPQNTRKLARLIDDLDSVSRRLKHYLSTVHDMELDSRALQNMNKLHDPLVDTAIKVSKAQDAQLFSEEGEKHD